MVIGVLPGIILNVLPSTTASEGDTENVRPPAVTTLVGWELVLGSATVVLARPIPCGPMLTVCPFITVIIGSTSGPMENVFPAMTAWDGATANVKPPAVIAWNCGGGVGIGMVVPWT